MAVSKVILNGDTLIDATTATAAASDIIAPKTAMLADGVMTTGTGSGGSVNPTADEDDVIFIDYDGTIRYSYTASEFASLTELPANPVHEGLTAQGWNWTLADAKAYVADLGGLCIGQNYITTSGDTEVDLVLVPGVTDGIISLCVNGEVEIDFGDGSTPESVTGTSLTTKINTQHNWPSAGGNFTYKISLVSGSYKLTGQGYNAGSCSGLYWGGIETNSRNNAYLACVRRVRLGAISGFYDSPLWNLTALETITVPSGLFTEFPNYFGNNTYSLRAFVFPPTSSLSLAASYILTNSSLQYTCSAKNTRNFSSAPGAYGSCRQLLRVYIPPTVTVNTATYGSCTSLNRVFIPDTVTEFSYGAFSSCYALPKITVPPNVTTIGATAFQNCVGLKEVHMRPTTPPTLSNTNAFSGVQSTCVIYVPYSEDHSVLTAYQEATNWSTYASMMQEEPQ